MNMLIRLSLLGCILGLYLGCKTTTERPQIHNSYEEERSTVTIDGLQIPVAITSPVNKPLKAAILIIPGAMHSDVDGNYPEWNANPSLYAQLSQELAKRGYKTMRYAKHGAQTGAKIINEQKAQIFRKSFEHRVNVADYMARELIKNIPKSIPLIVAGHSEGSLVALLLAERKEAIKGLISLAGTSQRYLDMVYDGTEKMIGSIPGLADPKKSLQDLKNAFKKVRSGKSIADETKTKPLLMGFKDLEPLDWQYIREHDSYDPVQEIRKVSLPVLILQGKQDPLVEYKQAQILHDSSKDHERTKLIYFNDLQHFFQKQTSQGAAPLQFSGAGPLDSKVAESIDQWVQDMVLAR